MNNKVNLELLSSSLLKHQDKVVRLDSKWMILDGIDRYGGILPDQGLLSVYYASYVYWVRILVSNEMYFGDYDFTWPFIRRRIATKIKHLRNHERTEDR